MLDTESETELNECRPLDTSSKNFPVTAISLFSNAVVPNIFGVSWKTIFPQTGVGGDGGGMVQAVTRAMGSTEEQQRKLRLLACCSPPAVQPGS